MRLIGLLILGCVVALYALVSWLTISRLDEYKIRIEILEMTICDLRRPQDTYSPVADVINAQEKRLRNVEKESALIQQLQYAVVQLQKEARKKGE